MSGDGHERAGLEGPEKGAQGKVEGTCKGKRPKQGGWQLPGD